MSSVSDSDRHGAGGPPGGSGRRDLISLFVRHPTAANLLMVLMILAGVFALLRMNTQFFPDFGIDIVTVSVQWSGASAEDVDSNIVEAIEREVRFLDGVKRVRSTANEGLALVIVEFHPGTDMQAALSDVEASVGQVTTLPDDSERPEVRRVIRYDPIVRIVLSGPYSEGALKAVAKRMRNDLLARGIDKIDLYGARDEEIWVEIPEERLLELDLTLEEVAARIRAISQDIPSGDTTGAFTKQIRSIGLARTAWEIAGFEIKALPSGEKIYLRDIAHVSEQFDEKMPVQRRNGHPAVELDVKRSTAGDALKLANIVDAYLEETIPTLPPQLQLERYEVQADLIRERTMLLVKNGLTGLVLVIVILFIFLNAPVAFWVAVGIPAAMMATLGIMLATGQTINMISLFGMIMGLGIVVDDAIVVGEHADAQYRRGFDPASAAEMGARRMTAPVFSASLTTIAAFTPLLVISDVIGDIISAVPYVVIAMIVASLIECFLALPGHLRSGLSWGSGQPSRARIWFNGHFNRFRGGPFRRFLTVAVNWRYATIATAFGIFVVSIGVVAGGRIGFQFFPTPEVDTIYANVQMSAGAPRSQTATMVDALERAMLRTEDELTAGEGGLVRFSVGTIGATVGRRDAGQGRDGDHLGGITVELIPSDRRDVRTNEFIAAWRAAVEPVAGLESMTILPLQGGPPGRPVDVRLSGENLEVLKEAAREVRELLARYPGVSDVDDNLDYGKREAIMELTPQGRAFGFTTESVGRQVRSAFDGAVARRFARGDEEVRILVRMPRARTDSDLLDTLYVRSPDGIQVPLRAVVTFRETQGFARIRREDGARQISVTAEIDPRVTSTDRVIDALERDGIYGIARSYGANVKFEGRAEEQRTTQRDMMIGAAFGLIAIYIILAWVFASYSRPAVVMSVIPLSFVGAVAGHWLLGYDMTILSQIALIALAGIVVNNAIILVTTIEARIREGQSTYRAVIDGTCERLRPVILTSLTTIGGLTPLMFETSLQAQFLIPMAITVVFGLMVTTWLVLFVIPALILIQRDLSRLFGRWPGGGGRLRAAEPAE